MQDFLKMKRAYHIIAILFLFSLLGQAQVDSVYYGNRKKPETKKEKPQNNEPKEDWRKKLIWGGNFQAWFGQQTFIFLSPNVGYPVYKNLILGVGIVYNYSNYYGQSNSIYGIQTYGRYIIRSNYFVQASLDHLLQPNYISPEPNDNIWVRYFMVGGGFRRPLSEKTAFTTSFMYYVNPSPLSIYPSRLIIQFGMSASF